MEKRVTRLFTGPDGESHFEDIEFPLQNKASSGLRSSELLKATGIRFGEMGADYKPYWHPAPHRQIVITLEGRGEIEISDGTKRQFGPNDVVLAEDTTGRGHIHRVLSNEPEKLVFIILD
ncbi:hypothetical protein ACFLW4_04630 [Chloroflexota bacterium]